MAGSSPLLEPPVCTRPALAVVVPTRCSSSQFMYVHVFMLHNFQLNQHLWLAHGVKRQHGIAARAPRAAGRPRGAAARRIGAFAANQRIARVVQQPFSSNLLHVLWAAL